MNHRDLEEFLMYPYKINAKLNQNESPFPPPEIILKKVCESLRVINRYQTRMLFDKVLDLYSEYSGVNKSHLWLGPGIDILFEKIFHRYSGEKFLVVMPTYFYFVEQAKHFKIRFVETSLDRDFRVDLDKVFEFMNDVSIIYFDNPNNPTGNIIIKRKQIEEILESFRGILLIDEAYFEFCGETVIDLVESYENLVVLRTMSKAFSMAGMRITIYALGEGLRNLIHEETEMFRVSTPALIAAKEALENIDYVKKLVAFVKSEREKMIDNLKKLGYKGFPSYTNFVLIDTGIRNVYQKLFEREILVKDVSSLLGEGFIRVTIGSKSENDLFLNAMKEFKCLN